MILGGITRLPNLPHKTRVENSFSCVEIIMILDPVRQRLLFILFSSSIGTRLFRFIRSSGQTKKEVGVTY